LLYDYLFYKLVYQLLFVCMCCVLLLQWSPYWCE